MKVLIVLTVLVSSFVHAQTTPKAPAQSSCPPCVSATTCPAPPTCPEPKKEENTATFREDSFGTVLGGFQFLNTWVPSKGTLSYTQIFSRDFSLELEYASSEREVDIAGVELGVMSENRYTLLLKYYVGPSFALSVGPYINEIAFKLGDNITNAAGDKLNEELELSLVGISFGIGNRWQLKNGITLGVDWLRINQPTGTYKVKKRILKDVDADDQDDTARTMNLLKSFPAFTFFGVNVGYTF